MDCLGAIQVKNSIGVKTVSDGWSDMQGNGTHCFPKQEIEMIEECSRAVEKHLLKFSTPFFQIRVCLGGIMEMDVEFYWAQVRLLWK